MKLRNVFLSMFFVTLIIFSSCKEDKIDVTGITLDKSTITLLVAEEYQLLATIEPADAENKEVEWTSTDETIATVVDGKVTGKSAGTSTITAKTVDGGFTATCEVTVVEEAVGEITEIMTKGFLTNSAARSIDITCDANGTPYIVNNTNDASLDSKAYVQVHSYSGSGTTWNKYSNQNVGICDDESATSSIAISSDGKVFVSYEYFDNIDDNKYSSQIVAAFDGSNWVTLGGDGSTNNNCLVLGNSEKGQSQMAFKQDGTLLIAISNYGDGYVNYFENEGDWSMFSGYWTSYSGYKLDDANFWAGNVDIAVDGNKPYAYIRTDSGDGKCGILGGSETNGENIMWEWLGNSLVGNNIQGSNYFETSLALSSTGEIYSSYQKMEGVDLYVYVKYFNKTSNEWEIIYTSDVYDSYQNEAEVVVANDVLYLAVAKYNGGVEIFKYDSENNEWNKEGTTPDIGANYYSIDLAAGNNGEFYIAYAITESGTDYEIGVYKYTPAAK